MFQNTSGFQITEEIPPTARDESGRSLVRLSVCKEAMANHLCLKGNSLNTAITFVNILDANAYSESDREGVILADLKPLRLPATSPPLAGHVTSCQPVEDRTPTAVEESGVKIHFSESNFLCYTCKEYVEDLGKIPQNMLQESNVRLVVIGQSSWCHIEGFCSLTGYPHEMYVDPERQIYKKLGMRRGETYMETPSSSPHVKSSLLVGSLKSMWRAMTSPVFDFQGDPLQQGGALIVGPGPEVHFAHFDMNRLDHMPINWLLQLAGVQTLDFSDSPKIIHI
ncbi:thioredoxin AAED1 [Labeo rohita]|uniref:Thioredoxin AAED1 n=1 Tax=Labeo rohita TaxID=84645 RepID=A0A498NA76_LABRO|nr:thioredoxin AAED1 [Labeo rohita]